MDEPVVETTNLSKHFGPQQALKHVTTEANTGDVIGILGKNGAGKTTLLEVLLGFSPASEGTARLFGEDSLNLPQACKSKIGFVPQREELLGVLTGAQQLSTTACFYPNWNRALVDRLTEHWQVPTDKRINTMSVGERQKLTLLLALGHEPELLVFDEPVASLDPIARRDFLQQLWDFAAERTRTVLFSSHIVSDLERAANKVWILKDGELAWQGSLDALKESVVRLHIQGRNALPASLDIAGTITSRRSGREAVVTVGDWHGDERAGLCQRLQADIEVESMGLEDIFVELHR